MHTSHIDRNRIGMPARNIHINPSTQVSEAPKTRDRYFTPEACLVKTQCRVDGPFGHP